MRRRLADADPRRRVLDLRGVEIGESLAALVEQELRAAGEIGSLLLDDAVVSCRIALPRCRVLEAFSAAGARFQDVLSVEGAADATSLMEARFDALVRIGRFEAGSMFSFRQARFADSVFVGVLPFEDVTYTSELDFQSAVIDGGVLFGDGGERRGNVTGRGTVNFAHARIAGDVELSGLRVEGNLTLEHARVAGNLYLRGAAVSGGLSLAGTQLDGRLLWDGSTFGSCLFRRAIMGSPLDGSALTIERWLVLDEATFAKPVRLQGSAQIVHMHRTTFEAGASIQVSGDLVADGTVFGGRSEISAPSAPAAPVRLLSLRAAEVGQLALSDLDLSRCLLRGAHGLERLRLGDRLVFDRPPPGRRVVRDVLFEECLWRGAQPRSGGAGEWAAIGSLPDWLQTGSYPAGTAALPIAPAHVPGAVAVSGLYRVLRQGREDAKDAPGAADFYYGEMEMRRHAGRGAECAGGLLSRLRDRFVLAAYWLTAGYGLSAARALLSLVVLLAAATWFMHCWGFTDPRSLGEATRFTLTAATSLLRPVDDSQVTDAGFAVTLLLRLLGPALLALVVLALRARIKR